jgi:membrane protein implicated in regulation of membrane protease activity
VTLGDTLGAVPGTAWLAVLVLSIISGLMALLQRMSLSIALEQQLSEARESEYEEISLLLRNAAIPKGWKVFVVWHMLGALSMGALSFLFLESTDMHDFLEAVAIALSAYSGARLFDKVSAGFSNKVLGILNRKDNE